MKGIKNDNNLVDKTIYIDQFSNLTTKLYRKCEKKNECLVADDGRRAKQKTERFKRKHYSTLIWFTVMIKRFTFQC